MMEPLIAIRRSDSVIGRYNVCLENAYSSYPLAKLLSYESAMRIATEKSLVLKLRLKMHLLTSNYKENYDNS